MAIASTAPSRIVGVFSGEYGKTRSFPSIRKTVLFGLVAVVVVSAFGVLQTIRYVGAGREDQTAGLTAADWPMLALHLGQVIPILLGAWVFGQDIGTGPRRVVFLASARRIPLALVKLTTVALLAAFTALVCTLGALAPLLFSGAGGTVTVDLARYGWLIGYWTLIALASASITAATRSLLLGVVPLLAWTLGLADLLVAQFPGLTGSIDQVFKAAYQGSVLPSPIDLAVCAVQLVVVVVIGVAAFTHRDTT